MRRSTIIAMLLLAGACDMDEKLEGEPCGVDKDCWHNQECVRTDAERELDLPGLCEEEGTACFVGGQLGCACVPDDVAANCSSAEIAGLADYPEMMCEPTQRVCVLATLNGTTEG